MTELFQSIRSYLVHSGYEYDLVEHDPVQTSEEARQVLGHDPWEGTKSLVLDVGGSVVVATVPAPREVPLDRIATLYGDVSVDLCDPGIIENQLGTELGGVAPFGYGVDAQTLIDSFLFTNDRVYFNPGRNDVTAVMSGETFRSIVADWSVDELPSDE